MLAVLPAMGAMFANDDEAAIGHARELQDQPDPWVRAVARSMLGGLLVNLGEADRAEVEFDAALAAFRQLGERWGLGQVLVARAELSAARGRHADAVAAIEEAREAFVGLGDREDVGQIMIRLAQERARAGRFEQARDDLARAGRIADEVGAEDQKLFIRHTLADMARLEGRLEEARELLDAAIAAFGEVGYPIEQRLALLLVSRARVDLAAGDARGAGRWCDQALRTALSSRDRPVIARVVDLLAEVTLAAGDAGRAATLLGMAQVLRGMPVEADGDAARVRAAARAALGGDRFGDAYRRGAALQRGAVLAQLVPGGDAGRATAAAARPAPGDGR
jgi:tetratricopeptide (TPR) repeat protein